MESSVIDVGGNESMICDNRDSDLETNVKILKRRSALERQLESNLTSKITSLSTNTISPNTSRYGRARKSKNDEDFYQTEKEVSKAIKTPPMSDMKVLMSPKALKMNAAKSPLKTKFTQSNAEKKIDTQPYKSPTKNAVPNSNRNYTYGHSEKVSNPINFCSTNKQMKVYVRKDLIQNRTENTSSLMTNMFSPPKSTCLNGSITSPIFDKFTVENGDCNKDISPRTKHAFVDHSGSVVKALDFTGNQTENKKTIIECSTFIKKTTNMDDVIAERLDEELCPWKDGDVTWARIGSHPFWPCLITRDPYSKRYLKRKTLGRSTNVTYVLHVTFFADNGRRGWVMSNMLMMFKSLEEFRAEKERITPEQRKKDPKYYNAFTVSQSKLRKWTEAANEAEMILRRPAEYRVDFFNDLFSKPDVKLEESVTPQKASKKKPKTDNTNISLSESLFDSLFASENEISVSEKVKNKSRNNSFDVSDVVTACLDNIATKVGNRKIQRQSHMDRWLQKAKSPNKVNGTKKSVRTKAEKKTVKSKSESIRAVTKNLNTEMDSRKNQSDSILTVTDLVAKLDESKTSSSEEVQISCDINNENGDVRHTRSNYAMELGDNDMAKYDDSNVQNTDNVVKNDEFDDMNNENLVNEDSEQVEKDDAVKFNGRDPVKKIEIDAIYTNGVNDELVISANDENAKRGQSDDKKEKKYGEGEAKSYEEEVVCVIGLNDEKVMKYKEDDVEINKTEVIDIDIVNTKRHINQCDDEVVEQVQNCEEKVETDKEGVESNETEVIEMNGVNYDVLIITSDDKSEGNSQNNDKDSENTSEALVENNETEVIEMNGVNEDEIVMECALESVKKVRINAEKEKNTSEDMVEADDTNAMEVDCVDDDTISTEYDEKNYENNEKDRSVIEEEKNDVEIKDSIKVSNDRNDKIGCNRRGNDTDELIKSETVSSLNVTPLNEQNGNAMPSVDEKIEKFTKVLRSRKATTSPSEEMKVSDSCVDENVITDKKVLRSQKTPQQLIDESYEVENHTVTETSSSSESEKEISPKKTGKTTKSQFDDPDFQHFVNIRRDNLMDENPDLSEDDLMQYLYKTWLYEETYKTDEMKNDDTQQLVKGLGDETSVQPKKKRKQKAFVEKDVDKSNRTFSPRDKPARKRVVKNYINDLESSDEELEKTPKKVDVLNTTIQKNNIKVEKKLSPTSDNTIKAYFTPEPKKPLESNKESVVVTETEEEEMDFHMKSLMKPKPNIFKGLLKERVCEICETPGNLVKCKGSCGGVFHIDCCKNKLNSPTKEDESLTKKRGKKKKKPRRTQQRSDENDESQTEMDMTLDNSPGKSTDVRINGKIKEENVSPNRRMSFTANALEFESQTSIKMAEIMTETKYDTSDMDMLDSTEDECDWDQMEAGKCEIVDVKLKTKKEVVEIQEKTDLEKEIDSFKCNSCSVQKIPSCFVCSKTIAPKTGNEIRQKCSVVHCGKVYHLECLNVWPQTQFNSGAPSKNNRKISVHYEAITCPRHMCHTCVSDDPRGCKTRFSGDKLARCVRCPATYHSITQCVPAGTRILTASQIVCPRHYERRPGKIPYHVNTAWCFICASGGTLICCETCPTSFHAECLNISPPEEGYICEDCETGRLPLYGELVWVKLGNYRWWPGLILHPHEVPTNIMAMKHMLGEFVVRFFGALDHYWVNRGRVFPYQEGDTGNASAKKSAVDSSFILAVQQAARAYTIIQKQKQSSVEPSDITSSLLPPHYVKLKVNKPCGSLAGRKADVEADSLTQCDCDPDDDEPCGPESDCLNRMLLTECGAACASEDRCRNRMFEKRQYPALTPYRTPHRGWGLKTLQDVKQGQFVIEYVGEVLDEQEFRRRMKRKHEIKDENYYFLTLDKDRMIDAGPKGNVARFMNHCCEPNCETQKWTVNGDVRVGLFAINDIPANTEVTFNYNLECAGVDKKRCLCGAPRCSGYIGAKLKDDPEMEKKKRKKLEQQQLKRKNKKKNSTNSPSTSKKIKSEKKSPPKLPLHVTGEDSLVMSSPILKNKRKNVEKPLSKEMQEIENDLQIIRNATNLLDSTEIEAGIDNSNTNHVKSSLKNTSLQESDLKSNSLKRKRVSFSSEEIIIYGSEVNAMKSPHVKILRLQNCDLNGISEPKSEILNGDCFNGLSDVDQIIKKVKGRAKKGLPPPIST